MESYARVVCDNRPQICVTKDELHCGLVNKNELYAEFPAKDEHVLKVLPAYELREFIDDNKNGPSWHSRFLSIDGLNHHAPHCHSARCASGKRLKEGGKEKVDALAVFYRPRQID